MPDRTVKKSTKQELPKGKKSFFRDISALFLFAAALFFAASLLSYSPEDPSLTHYTLNGSGNWMGPVGANLAAFLTDVLGHASWWLVIFLVFAAFYSLGAFHLSAIPPYLILYGLCAMLFSSCGLLSLVNREYGGIAGTVSIAFLSHWIGTPGTILVLFLVLFSGLLAATPLSLHDIISGIARMMSHKARPKQNKDKDIVPVKKPSKELPSSKEEATVPKITEARREGAREEKSKFSEDFQITPVAGKFVTPPLNFLADPPEEFEETDKDIYISNAKALERKLLDFGVAGHVVEICAGPVVTMYEFEPAPGVKINKVASLADDLAMALKTHSIRIVAPIPGKSVIGIEMANTKRQIVYLKEILADDTFKAHKGILPLALGQDIMGKPVVTDLARMPHLLIAGATGTGKSVGLNTMICSLLYRHGPDKLRLLMIDPKRIELSLYDGIPHLLHPVVSEPKEATRALRWAVMEMERRYQLLEEAKARNMEGYNKNAEEPLPFLVVIIDELADLMMVSSKEVESSIARLAQMARAAGIHLLVATQRPSVDVLTGLIKANFPARISFKVSSKVDSRTILDIMGAERLLGMGDMLFLPPGSATVQRIHGAYVSEPEITKVVDFLKEQGEPQYDLTVTEAVPGDEESGDGIGSASESVDEKYDEAIEIVTQSGQASISMLQRKMRIGYNRAARMIEQMEKDGIVSPTDSMGRRKVLVRGYD